MFFNASIQGLYRTGRVFFEQPKRAAALSLQLLLHQR